MTAGVPADQDGCNYMDLSQVQTGSLSGPCYPTITWIRGELAPVHRSYPSGLSDRWLSSRFHKKTVLHSKEEDISSAQALVHSSEEVITAQALVHSSEEVISTAQALVHSKEEVISTAQALVHSKEEVISSAETLVNNKDDDVVVSGTTAVVSFASGHRSHCSPAADVILERDDSGDLSDAMVALGADSDCTSKYKETATGECKANYLGTTSQHLLELQIAEEADILASEPKKHKNFKRKCVRLKLLSRRSEAVLPISDRPACAPVDPLQRKGYNEGTRSSPPDSSDSCDFDWSVLSPKKHKNFKRKCLRQMPETEATEQKK